MPNAWLLLTIASFASVVGITNSLHKLDGVTGKAAWKHRGSGHGRGHGRGGHNAARKHYGGGKVFGTSRRGRVNDTTPIVLAQPPMKAQEPVAPVADSNLGSQSMASDVSAASLGLMRHKGLVTMYTSKRDSTLLLLDLKSLVAAGSGKSVLASAAWARGTFQEEGGQQTTLHEPVDKDTMLSFALSEDGALVDVSQPLLSLRTSDSQARTALRRGAWSGWTYSLERLNASKLGLPADSILVDGSQFIANGFFISGWKFKQNLMSYRVRSSRVYEHNLLVTVSMQLQGKEGAVPVDISFSMVELPNEPMKPRPSDDRLGFFTTDYTDVGQQWISSKDSDVRAAETVDREISVINRFNVSAAPDQQLRFYVDPTVPKRWRSYFKEGVEAWNQAFAKIGRPKAVRAILPDSDEWPKDYDPDDARYSTISWSIELSSAYALGLAKMDPRSGQILKSDIIVTSGWVSAWLGELDLEAQTVVSEKGDQWVVSSQPTVRHNPALGYRLEKHSLSRELSEHPSWARHDDEHASVTAGQDQEFEAASVTFSGLKNLVDRTQWEDAIGSGLRSVVMHETGHALGLRHNFKASMGIDEDCLRDPKCASTRGLAVSVMDYVPANLLGLEKKAPLFSPVIGEYDELAIKYGYSETDDEEELNRVLVKAEKLPVCSDEELSVGSDPYCAAHDLGAHPLVYYKTRLETLARVQKDLFDKEVREGESYADYGRASMGIFSSALNIGAKVLPFLGGLTVRRLHRSSSGKDGGSKSDYGAVKAVSGDVQREALNLIIGIMKTNISTYLPPTSARPFLLERVGTNAVRAVDVNGAVRKVQRYFASKLVSHDVLERLFSSASFGHSGRNGLQLSEYLDIVMKALIGELEDAQKHPRQWDMQGQLVTGLRDIARKRCSGSSPPLGVQAEVTSRIENLRSKTTKVLGKNSADENSLQPGAFEAYIMYLSSELTKASAPCSSSEAASSA
eukprot:TRINITY_DN66889_c2_g1_i1.p1 TRINITY_DN66889_c2_g1~~TRINITY_DN66889_c2_g1_i1.p1  ORF type:complete len:967 (+),score=144.70 TRINITY_DN66889_c2_g1_i1:102-3002(+)